MQVSAEWYSMEHNCVYNHVSLQQFALNFTVVMVNCAGRPGIQALSCRVCMGFVGNFGQREDKSAARQDTG